ncbi:MAG: glutamate--tRNA ligase [Patescibacteria group bacterium]|nr:glutamate--tRNA ligase [Patescibacteria group bacterium]
MNSQEELKLTKAGAVRARIAPSPTGFFHVGGARTALFNYLFAKQNNGIFVLRIEDTDKERSKPVYEDNIIESLKWLGISPDEGPAIDGNYGPYRQSERKEIYEKYLEKLLDEKKAYHCFCSEEELKIQKEYQLSIGQAPRYSGKCAGLSEQEVEDNLKQKKKFVYRFMIAPKKIEFNDLIRGKIEIDSALMGDTVIARDDAMPLYNFACVIDDFEMKITHVIRGEEHISNTPRQILLQKALGFPKVKYAHLPLILGSDKSKLSKRHGAASVIEYKELGYLPEALNNFLAFLGWNPDTNKEIFSLDALIKEFSLEKVQKSGAVFNTKRLDFLNGVYIRQKPINKLTELCIPHLIQNSLIELEFKQIQFPPAYGGKEIINKFKITQTKKPITFDVLSKIVSIYQERLKKLSDLPEFVDFFFKKNLDYDKDLLKWKDMSEQEVLRALDRSNKILSDLKEEEFDLQKLTDILLQESEKFGKKIKSIEDRGYLLWPLRVALTGQKSSAPPFEIAEILGKEQTLKRINQAKELLQ